jgi:hypothetical protein
MALQATSLDVIFVRIIIIEMKSAIETYQHFTIDVPGGETNKIRIARACT